MSRTFLLLVVALLSVLAACSTKSDDKSADTVPGTLAEIEGRILKDPTNAALFAERARYFDGLDSARAALNDWQRAIALDSTNVAYHIAMADLFYRKVRVAEAEKSLLDAIRVGGPEETEALLKLSELKLIQREYPRAMELANEALRIDQQNAKGYYLKGWIHMEAGDTVLAVSSYRTAVEQDPSFFDAFLQLGQLHAAIGDPLASEYYNAALEIRPGSVEAWYGLGMLAQENRVDSVALACYANIKVIEPRNPLGWYNTGYVLLELRNQPELARPEFRRAIQLMPTWPEAYYNHGLTYELVGQLDSALVDYRKALALAPDMTLAAKGLERLQAKGIRVMR